LKRQRTDLTDPFLPPSENRYNAPALEKGLRILEVLATSAAPLNTMEIGRLVGRSRNEIYRMLAVLESHNYIVRDPGGDGFVITNKLFSLGMRTAPVLSLTEAALPEMRRLAATVGQAVNLVVPSGDQIVFIARSESPAAFGFTVELGYHRHVLASSSGLLLFALQSPERQATWLERLRRTAPPGADIDDFLAEAAKVREQGWLVRESVTVEGVRDVCAAIWSADGCVANLLVPHIHLYADVRPIEEMLADVVRAAKRISAELVP
jgi:DNA-binding IclR family transcriptional regulator